MTNMLAKGAHRGVAIALGVAVLLFLVVPVIIVLPMSFSANRYLELPPQSWSWRWYDRFLSSPDWTEALLTSLKVAFCASIIATPLGVAAAWALHSGAQKWLRHLQVLLLLPLMVPHIVLAIALFYFYAKFAILGDFAGVVAAHVLVALPFVVVVVLGSFSTYDKRQDQIAQSLGASVIRTFFQITLPQIKSGVLTAFLFGFVTSMDEVIISLFVSSGRNETITKVMFSSVATELDPTVAAVSSILTCVSLVVLSIGILARHLLNRSPNRVNAARIVGAA